MITSKLIIIVIIIAISLLCLSESSITAREYEKVIVDSINAAWKMVNDYYSKKSMDSLSVIADPQPSYAAYFYDYYLNNPASRSRDQALEAAILMWHNNGDLENINKAIETIDDSSEIWARLLMPIQNTYVKHDRYEEFIELAHSLENRLTNLKSKSALYHALAMYYWKYAQRNEVKNTEKARSYLEEIIALKADSFAVRKAVGDIYELDSLNVGQRAPIFCTVDINGREISLLKLSGKYVLLDFWATSCGPCVKDMPNLVEAYSVFKREKIEFIGISVDKDIEILKKFVSEHDITWPQIHDMKNGNIIISQKYNIYLFPSVYFIGPDGTILAKWHHEKDLVSSIRELMKHNDDNYIN